MTQDGITFIEDVNKRFIVSLDYKIMIVLLEQ
jgi:hypothetical protein